MSYDAATARAHFLDLHATESPLLLPNPWDLGSARMLASMGFKALATTSGGFAASLGRLDGSVQREEALAQAVAIAQATGLPVNADLENCYADDPQGVAETVELACEAGVAGCSVEDWSGSEIYDIGLAGERVAATAEAAHAAPVPMVLTARAENHARGGRDIDDTIARLLAYEAAGADVLFAPRLRGADEIRLVLDAVRLPVNVLAGPDVPNVAELAAAGVKRVSVGSAFALAAYGTLLEIATELQEQGSYGYLARARRGFEGARLAFRAP